VRYGTAEPVPFVDPSHSKNLLGLRKAPINSSNLILFAHAPSKAINNLHRQKTSSSSNVDSFEVQPSLRDSLCMRLFSRTH
jgi:hypothetical protein